jgi:hypothetical protein
MAAVVLLRVQSSFMHAVSCVGALCGSRLHTISCSSAASVARLAQLSMQLLRSTHYSMNDDLLVQTIGVCITSLAYVLLARRQ